MGLSRDSDGVRNLGYEVTDVHSLPLGTKVSFETEPCIRREGEVFSYIVEEGTVWYTLKYQMNDYDIDMVIRKRPQFKVL